MTFEELCRVWHDADAQLAERQAVAEEHGTDHQVGGTAVDRWWDERGVSGVDLFKMVQAHPPPRGISWEALVSQGLQVGCLIGERLAAERADG